MSGHDPDFNRGQFKYDRYYGDSAHTPNPCLNPLDTPPFYALRIVVGDVGTLTGLNTDASARVLDSAGLPIRGLYAVGNDMSNVFGGAVPGGGMTLGPGMTFGYIAGRHVALANTSPSGPD
jgi:predicted oxidoreductase